MKISFCITYHNQANYVKQSINSILSLEIPCEFEILIGDDNSTDDTLKIAESYSQKYPNNIFIHKMPSNYLDKNPIHRVSKNRIELLRHSSGDFITFIDGDDFVCNTTYIQKALQVFESYYNLAAVAFDFKYLYKNGGEEIKTLPIGGGLVDTNEYLKSFWIHAGSFIFKSYYFKDNIKILEDSKYFDDNLISIFALQFGSLYYYKDVVYVYVQHESSIWNSSNEIEKSTINMLDYEVLCNVAPKFKKLLFSRQYHSIKNIFKHRKTIKNELGDNYQKYLNEAKKLNNSLGLKLLQWQKLSFKDKFALILWFYYKKQIRKFI